MKLPFLSTKQPRRSTASTKSNQTKVTKHIDSLSYIHEINTRSKSYRLKLNTEGMLVAVTPARYSQQKLDEFIRLNQGWIINQQSKLNHKKALLETDQQLMIFGKYYQKKYHIDPTQPSVITLEQTQLLIQTPDESTAKKKRLIDRFLEQVAEQYLVPRTQSLLQTMQQDFPQIRYTAIKFGEHKTQWGSCHRNGTLTFNWRLIHAPRAVVDYVIIHELAHLIHHNHSHAFWQVVHQFDPTYKQHQQWLKQFGVSAG